MVNLKKIPASTAITKKVQKRDGRLVDFDSHKIYVAIERCFKNTGLHTEEEYQSASAKITKAVVNIFGKKPDMELTVDNIQKVTIQQIWALGYFEEAEQYTLFKEKRKQERISTPADPELRKMVDDDAQYFPTALQYYQFISKFSKWNEALGRRETWGECVNRVMGFFGKQPFFSKLSQKDQDDLKNHLHKMDATPAMRVIQMAGDALERCNVGVYNCSYMPISDIKSFSELLYILMQGTGAGFSVERKYVDQLPPVKRQRGKTGGNSGEIKGKTRGKSGENECTEQNFMNARWIVSIKQDLVPTDSIDSSLELKKHVIIDDTEGWCDALTAGLNAWFNGEDIEFDYSNIRPAGTRLKTKGGRASGPGPLMELMDFARNLILSRQGQSLSDIDCHDLACKVGKIVQVGGVRRASEISLSDLNSIEMRNAKTGTWWTNNLQRTMANNSAVYTKKPSTIEFMEEWLALAKSGSGERGIFNRDGVIASLPERRKAWTFGTNPCAEIILRPYQFCNLSIVVAREDDTPESLARKVRIATIFGTMQSCLTNFKYIRNEWKENCEEERLLGVDITGQMDCPILRPGAKGREELLKSLKDIVGKTNEEYSKLFGIPRSAADTCVKPSGDSAVMFGCSSGIHARFAKYYIRRVRERADSPIAQMLKDAGVPWIVAPEDASLVAFEFPCASPKGAITKDKQTALDQLDNWLAWKRHWAEHSVSATVYLEQDEWLEAGYWVYKNFDEISGISFLPRDNGTYTGTPYEEINETEYKRRVETFPQVDWAKLSRYEKTDHTESAQTYACTGGVCEL